MWPCVSSLISSSQFRPDYTTQAFHYFYIPRPFSNEHFPDLKDHLALHRTHLQASDPES